MPLHIIRQDITKIRCDAIINPTNNELIPGGGTDKAIHIAAGKRLADACAKLSVCETGQAVITPGFDLPCKYVIHTVGPIWKGGLSEEYDLLKSCYIQSLQLAKKHKCRSVAFPLISSGTYGYPKDQVLKIAIDTIGEFLYDNEMAVTIAVFDSDSYALSRELSDEVTAYIDDHYIEDDLSDCSNFRRTYGRRSQNISAKSCRKNSVPFIPIYSDEIPLVDESDETSVAEESAEAISAPNFSKVSLDEMLRSMDKGFADTLFGYIDAKGMNDVECYKRANIDRKTFSKIKCNRNYKPSKQTVLSFAIALKLTLEETNHLLNTVGMSLSHSSKFDVIIEYFILNGKYDIFEINETLFAFDQMLLGG